MLLLDREVGVGVSGTIAGTSVLAGVWALVDSEPACEDRAAAGQDRARERRLQRLLQVRYFEMFTEEIENSTMNSAISSVIMSA